MALTPPTQRRGPPTKGYEAPTQASNFPHRSGNELVRVFAVLLSVSVHLIQSHVHLSDPFARGSERNRPLRHLGVRWRLLLHQRAFYGNLRNEGVKAGMAL